MQPPTKEEFSVAAQIRKSGELFRAEAERNAPEDPQHYLIEGESFSTPQPRRPEPGGGSSRIQ